MLKIVNLIRLRRAFTLTVIRIGVWVLAGLLCQAFVSHPYYLGVTELKYNPKSTAFEISIKLFTNDLENALKKTTTQPVDLLNPKNKEETQKLVSDYIHKHFSLKVNKQAVSYTLIGYEKEEDAVWIYLSSAKTTKPKSLVVDNTLLYDDLPQQIHITHLEMNGIKQSAKVTNPDHIFSFSL